MTNRPTVLTTIFMLCAIGSYAPRTIAQGMAKVLNKDLPELLYQEQLINGEDAARSVFVALQTDNKEALNAFIPSKEVYAEIIAGYPYETEKQRAHALDKLEKGYAEQVKMMQTNFAQIRDEATASSVPLTTLRIENVLVKLTAHETMRGGSATLQLGDGATHTLYLRMNGLYEHKGVWYLMNKMKWRTALADGSK